MESAFGETSPERRPEAEPLAGQMLTWRGPPGPQNGFSEAVWQDLVFYHTSCALTVPSDVHMVFAGLVEEIHTLTQDSCLAGLWSKGLERQLLVSPRAAITQPLEYMAPSWSRPSVTGAVELESPDDCESLIEVSEVYSVFHLKTSGDQSVMGARKAEVS